MSLLSSPWEHDRCQKQWQTPFPYPHHPHRPQHQQLLLPLRTHLCAPRQAPLYRCWTSSRCAESITTYESWSCQVAMVLFAIGAKSLVIDGITPAGMSEDVVLDLMQRSLLIIIQLVSEPVMTGHDYSFYQCSWCMGSFARKLLRWFVL